LCLTLICGFSGQPEKEGINWGSTKRWTSCQVQAQLLGLCADVEVSGIQEVSEVYKSVENATDTSQSDKKIVHVPVELQPY